MIFLQCANDEKLVIYLQDVLHLKVGLVVLIKNPCSIRNLLIICGFILLVANIICNNLEKLVTEIKPLSVITSIILNLFLLHLKSLIHLKKIGKRMLSD